MTTADERAREVIDAASDEYMPIGPWPEYLLNRLRAAGLRIVDDRMIVGTAEEITEFVIADLEASGPQIIDTSTHVAVPREPSEEMVERVAVAIIRADLDWSTDAAIAAIIGGGDAPP